MVFLIFFPFWQFLMLLWGANGVVLWWVDRLLQMLLSLFQPVFHILELQGHQIRFLVLYHKRCRDPYHDLCHDPCLNQALGLFFSQALVPCLSLWVDLLNQVLAPFLHLVFDLHHNLMSVLLLDQCPEFQCNLDLLHLAILNLPQEIILVEDICHAHYHHSLPFLIILIQICILILDSNTLFVKNKQH